MSRVVAKNERVINAHVQDVYDVLKDYKNKRPLILTHNFLDYKVERGGNGSGTEVSYRLRAANRERPYHLQISEPVKGQVLTEKDRNSSLITVWTLTPQNNGEKTRVNVTTEWEGASGVRGFFERTFAPRGLRSIYSTMFDLLTLLVQPTNNQSTTSEVERQGFRNQRWGIIFLLGLVAALAYIISRFFGDRRA